MTFDFDRMSATVSLAGEQTTLRVKDAYQGKYLVQAQLLMNFFAKGWTDLRFDDFDDQIEVLTWLESREYDESVPFVYGRGNFESLRAALADPSPTKT